MVSKISKIRSLSYLATSGSNDIEDIINIIYPVGCIYKSVLPENPSTYFGGEWVKWGSGNVIVGVNEEDEDFNESEKQGGSKDAIVVEHNHEQNSHTHTFSGTAHSHSNSSLSAASAGAHTHNLLGDKVQWIYESGTGLVGVLFGTQAYYTSSSAGAHTHSVSGSTANATQGGTNTATIATNNPTGEDGKGKNLQPYITCYMWKRVA